ncbi:hypothetical protein SCHPADRAFT_943489 [Schizopora paradoxa]|uniref:Secreted protein n=1 Tax=Schizopora paradoxa TaxID=27342 RepID=A0A0H2RCW9_9AGAM|nr:hypothetical protein SCHPADRAFT_943489 [Schizopora paradoxa]
MGTAVLASAVSQFVVGVSAAPGCNSGSASIAVLKRVKRAFTAARRDGSSTSAAVAFSQQDGWGSSKRADADSSLCGVGVRVVAVCDGVPVTPPSMDIEDEGGTVRE